MTKYKTNWKFKPLIISAPFGKYINIKHASSVYGSYTLNKRSGLLKQVVKTFRPVLFKSAFINKIGLKNSGIYNCTHSRGDNNLISITAINSDDWALLFDAINSKKHKEKNFKGVVLNLSCPNAKIKDIDENTFKQFNQNFEVILKLSPKLSHIKLIEKYLSWGAKNFIVSNTIPTKKGGVSGLPLLNHNINLIKIARLRFGHNYHIVGGGGITKDEHIKMYAQAGANSFALGTGIFKFRNLKSLLKASYKYSNF